LGPGLYSILRQSATGSNPFAYAEDLQEKHFGVKTPSTVGRARCPCSQTLTLVAPLRQPSGCPRRRASQKAQRPASLSARGGLNTVLTKSALPAGNGGAPGQPGNRRDSRLTPCFRREVPVGPDKRPPRRRGVRACLTGAGSSTRAGAIAPRPDGTLPAAGRTFYTLKSGPVPYGTLRGFPDERC